MSPTRLATLITMIISLFTLTATPAIAMAPPAYKALRRQVRHASFASNRIDIVTVAARSNTFNSRQVKGLLKTFSFSSGKLKALRVLSPRIVDPRNSFVILDVFTFSSGKTKAAQILKHAGSDVRYAPPPAYQAPPRTFPPPSYPIRPMAPRRRRPAQPRHTRGYAAVRQPPAMPMAPMTTTPAPTTPAPSLRYPTSAAWATQGYGRVSNVWPRSALKRLRRALKRARFSRDKRAALKLAIAARNDGLSSVQVLTILKAFGFSKDMVAALRIMEPKILAMPAQEVARIIKAYPFSADRLRVLIALKDTILDLENKHLILAAFTFSRDKRKAAKILARVRPRSPLYGTIRGRHVVFVIDVSGSMGAVVFTNAGRRVSRLDYVRYELRRALHALPPTATFNLVVFAGGILRWRPRGARATPRNVAQAIAFMDFQRPEGGTNIWDAMKTALAEPGVDEVHFLTDGTPTAGPVRGYRQVLARFRSLLPRRPVPIHGAALLMGHFQGDNKAQSAQLVCAIAHETGGVCRVLQ